MRFKLEAAREIKSACSIAATLPTRPTLFQYVMACPGPLHGSVLESSSKEFRNLQQLYNTFQLNTFVLLLADLT